MAITKPNVISNHQIADGNNVIGWKSKGGTWSALGVSASSQGPIKSVIIGPGKRGLKASACTSHTYFFLFVLDWSFQVDVLMHKVTLLLLSRMGSTVQWCPDSSHS